MIIHVYHDGPLHAGPEMCQRNFILYSDLYDELLRKNDISFGEVHTLYDIAKASQGLIKFKFFVDREEQEKWTIK